MGIFCLAFCIIIGFSINASAQQYLIPQWIKVTAKLWHENSVGDDEFMNGIQYLVQQKIINTSNMQQGSQSMHIPPWVKNVAGFWSNGGISDDDFTKSIEYLVQAGIIQIGITQTIPSPVIPPLQNTTQPIPIPPVPKPMLPMLMLTSQYNQVYVKYPYNFVVKIFDPKTNPDKNIDQFNGGISDVNITVNIIDQNNQLFAKLSGKTDSKGTYQGGVLIPYSNYKTQQMKVIVNATKNGYVTQSATMNFAIFNRAY